MFKKIALTITLTTCIIISQSAAFAQRSLSAKTYKEALQSKIDGSWIIPPNSVHKSALVSFDIKKNGQISTVTLLRSSNDQEFDTNAINAIYKASPFQPLLNLNSITVRYYFSPTLTKVTVFDDSLPTLATTATDPYMDAYASNLGNKVIANWNPKTLKRKRDVTAQIKLDNDGTLQDIKIQKSSNNKKFDIAVKDSIQNSVPFAPIAGNDDSEYKYVQMNFMYEKTKNKDESPKNVLVSMNNHDGYDKYIERIQIIINRKIDQKRCFCKKDTTFEINVDKNGKITYVKVLNTAKKEDFNQRDFNRKMIATLKTISLPPIPQGLNTDNFTMSYRVLTQRNRLLRNLISDYILWGCTTKLESYYIQKPSNI